MKKYTLLAVLALVCVTAIGQRTTRTGLRAKAAEAIETASDAPALVYDTIASPDRHAADINGYDKPLRSRRETFFVTNNGDKAVCRIAFTIKYLDSQRRMLHSASHNVQVDIPAGETRQVSVRSWDPQFNFYYQRSAVPKRAQQATPYDVTISVDTLFMAR